MDKIIIIWSLRNELKLVTFTFLIILSLPIISVFILTQTGVNIVSDALVGVDTITQVIQIKNPVDGLIVAEITSPIAWPVSGVITLNFGETSRYQIFHTGIDIANPQGKSGDPITPFLDGTIKYAREINWGYGKHVIIDHGNNLTSVYAHLDRIYVYEGQEIEIGDTIGTMGSTGWSTGPHLHFEIRVYGIPVNPNKFLR